VSTEPAPLSLGRTGSATDCEPPDWLAGGAGRGDILNRVSTAFRDLIAFIS